MREVHQLMTRAAIRQRGACLLSVGHTVHYGSSLRVHYGMLLLPVHYANRSSCDLRQQQGKGRAACTGKGGQIERQQLSKCSIDVVPMPMSCKYTFFAPLGHVVVRELSPAKAQPGSAQRELQPSVATTRVAGSRHTGSSLTTECRPQLCHCHHPPPPHPPLI